MNDKISKQLKDFYNNKGWKYNGNKTYDSNLFEDLRKYSKEYVSNTRLQLMNYIPNKGQKMLDFASGPIQYKEYLSYSKNFKKRYCLDISSIAINIAKKKLKKHGKFYNQDLFKINFPSNYFDCVISLHTIYHINKNKQEKAVRKLLKFVKKGKPVIIVYSNPNTIINKIKKFIGFKKKRNNNEIYFYTFSKNWWKRFEDEADVKIKCWRSFAAQHQKILFPNNVFGKFTLSILYKLENLFPNFFSKYFQYQTIILTKL